jgi:hypothetical protein
MQQILCDTPSKFEACLAEAEGICEQEGKGLYIYFTGAKNSDTGLSWCPDCTRAEPLVLKVLSGVAGGCVFLEVPIEREVYRQPDFSLRTDSRIQLKCVPTLMKWVRGKALGRLDDSQSQAEENIADLVAA